MVEILFSRLSPLTSFFTLTRLFESCPEAKLLFGYPIDTNPYAYEIRSSRRFQHHASLFFEMLDTSLNLLGPDIDLLTEIMKDLGVKHRKFGVKPEFFPIFGACLIDTLEECIGKKSFTRSTREAWQETYDALSGDMILAIRAL
jgi:hemoglobin-like flavoprotein